MAFLEVPEYDDMKYGRDSLLFIQNPSLMQLMVIYNFTHALGLLSRRVPNT